MTWLSFIGPAIKWLFAWLPPILAYLKGRLDQRMAGKSAILKARERQLEKANRFLSIRGRRDLARWLRKRGW